MWGRKKADCVSAQGSALCGDAAVFTAGELRQCSRQLQLTNTNRNTQFTSHSRGVTGTREPLPLLLAASPWVSSGYVFAYLFLILLSSAEEVISVPHTSSSHLLKHTHTYMYTHFQTPASQHLDLWVHTHTHIQKLFACSIMHLIKKATGPADTCIQFSFNRHRAAACQEGLD